MGSCAELVTSAEDSHKELVRLLGNAAVVSVPGGVTLAAGTDTKTSNSKWALFLFLVRVDVEEVRESHLVYLLRNQLFGD